MGPGDGGWGGWGMKAQDVKRYFKPAENVQVREVMNAPKLRTLIIQMHTGLQFGTNLSF